MGGGLGEPCVAGMPNRRPSIWSQDAQALALLTASGRAVDRPGYRAACQEAFPHLEDHSFGAVLADGTRAAISLLAGDSRPRLHGMVVTRVAESLPCLRGGIVASRPLSGEETASFLSAARFAARSRHLFASVLPLVEGRVRETPGIHIGWAHVVRLVPGRDPGAFFNATARRHLRQAERAGAEVMASETAKGFLPLYRGAANRLWYTRPDVLIQAVARHGVARFYDVHLHGEAVASCAVLPGQSYWVYWLAAQNEAGRRVHAGYPAVAAVLDDAHRAGARAVDLGSSLGIPGLADFKRRFGAEDVPILMQRSADLPSLVYLQARTRLSWVRSTRRRRS
jgi:Acetyltransferase (GNAT) domain